MTSRLTRNLVAAATLISGILAGGNVNGAVDLRRSVCAIGGLLITIKAAPIMLSIGHLGSDTVALQRAQDGFGFWSSIRGVFQVLAYLANFWSLVALPKPASRN